MTIPCRLLLHEVLKNDYTLPAYEKIYNKAITQFPGDSLLLLSYYQYLSKKDSEPTKKKFDILQKILKAEPKNEDAHLALLELISSGQNYGINFDEQVKKALKYNLQSEARENAVGAAINGYAKSNNVTKAEALFKDASINNRVGFSRLCGEMAKLFYKKGKNYNKERAWAYFMLPWSAERKALEGLSLEQKLSFAVKNIPTSSEEWFAYAMYRGNFYQRKYYPVEGVCNGLKKCIELLNPNVEKKIRHKAPYYLAKRLRTQKKYKEAVKYYKKSVDVEVDAWNAQETALALELDAEARKIPMPNREICKYYRLSADNMIQEKYHCSKTDGWYRAIIIYAAEMQHKYGSAEKAMLC